MTKRRQALLAAILTTLCAAIWLANCVLDVALAGSGSGQLLLHGLCTAAWTLSAAIWWLRWRNERRAEG